MIHVSNRSFKIEVGVSNLEESTEFYKEALGLKVLGTYENIEVDKLDRFVLYEFVNKLKIQKRQGSNTQTKYTNSFGRKS